MKTDDLIRALKAAKHLKRKCYDSLPVLARNLCDCPVPACCSARRISDSDMPPNANPPI